MYLIVCECVNEHGNAYAFVICNVRGVFFIIYIFYFSNYEKMLIDENAKHKICLL